MPDDRLSKEAEAVLKDIEEARRVVDRLEFSPELGTLVRIAALIGQERRHGSDRRDVSWLDDDSWP